MNAQDFQSLFHVGDAVTLIRNAANGVVRTPLTVENVNNKRIRFRVSGSGCIYHVFHSEIDHDPLTYESTDGGVTVRSGEFAWTYLLPC